MSSILDARLGGRDEMKHIKTVVRLRGKNGRGDYAIGKTKFKSQGLIN
jgi:hypothetical protein